MSLNISAAIKKYGFRHQEIAEKMDISEVGLSQHVNGNPSVKVLERIAEAIGCDVVELFEPLEPNNTVCPHCGNPITVKLEK